MEAQKRGQQQMVGGSTTVRGKEVSAVGGIVWSAGLREKVGGSEKVGDGDGGICDDGGENANMGPQANSSLQQQNLLTVKLGALSPQANAAIKGFRGQNGNTAFKHIGEKVPNVAGKAPIRADGGYQASVQQNPYARTEDRRRVQDKYIKMMNEGNLANVFTQQPNMPVTRQYAMQHPPNAFAHQFRPFHTQQPTTFMQGQGTTPYDFNSAARQANVPPIEYVQTSKAKYVVEGFVVPPNGQHGGMNYGIRFLRHPNGELRVEKRIAMSTEHQRDRSRAEKAILQQLTDAGPSNHINILHDSVYDKNDYSHGGNIASIILEHCDRGSLEGYIELQRQAPAMFEEALCWHVLAHMSAALSMCHFGIKDPFNRRAKIQDWNTICHLDIKPSNVFVSNKRGLGQEKDKYPRIVLGDFGCAVTRDDVLKKGLFPRDRQPFGTPGWFPPDNEFLLDEADFRGRYGKPTDIWQMGGLIQAMCLLALEPNQDLVNAGQPCGNGYSIELNYVVRECMHPNSKLRPTAVEVALMVRKNQVKLGLAKRVR